ncbi:hypothetical protein RB653_005742 [Dictyostelium firmibasis]|uniref:G domain-containing protein n=1 Tax=Dictyostelium firmibasis TaxID=79012 RepID=A0AAN7Z4S5_9MYCE
MSLVLPIPAGVNTLLITENDLGRGFSIDENGGNAKKSEVFISNKEHKSTFPKSDSSNLTLIRDNESLKSALDVGGELSLSYGLISGKVMGNYIDTSTSGNERLTFLYTRRIVDKIVELDNSSEPSDDISKITSIDLLRSGYGLFYISKIEFGAIIDLKITLESSDKSTMNQLKGELSGSLSIGALSLSVKAHIDKTESSSSSKLKVTSSVLLGGCKPIDRTDIQSFDDAIRVINSFEVDKDRLMPVRMEISPIPPRATPLLSLDPISLGHYKNKLSSIGSFYWEFQQMIIQLGAFNQLILPMLGEEDTSIYVQSLYSKVAQQITSLKKTQDSLVKFIQSSMKNILDSEIPCTDSAISEIKVNAQQMIGSTFTETEKGRWIGPTVNKIPTYKGIYIYKNKSKYEGFCLEGKRHGQGKLTYRNGNVDQLKSIDGIWEDDEVSFPSTVIHEGGSETKISDSKSSILWRDRLKKKPVTNSVEVKNLSTPDEFILKYFVKVDLIDDELFQDFYEQAKRSLDDRERYYFVLLGMTGTGKTTMIEFFLNILTGQIHDPNPQRATDLEDKGIGQSKTKSVCRYEIEYQYNDTWMFGITIVDTPGFADSGGMNKDRQHIKSILSAVGKLERLDSVSYVVNGALTRKTLEPLRVLCNVFSILPNEAFECVSTIITFCDNANQANSVRKVLNEMLDGIKDKPAIFMDNPWSQHYKNIFKDTDENEEDTSETLLGVDNTEELQKKMEAKTKVVQNFFIERIRSKTSFKPEGMKFLNDLKDEILEKLKGLAITVNDLSTITRLLSDLTDKNIESLINKSKSISMDEWLKDRGFALIDGKPKAKIMGTNPWPGGVYSTVCFAPECLSPYCHLGCRVDYTSIRGDNIFKNCLAFSGTPSFSKFTGSLTYDKQNTKCKICPSKCSYKQHVHVRFQLEWIEDDKVLEVYYSIKNGALDAMKKSQEYENQAKELKKKYSEQLLEFSKLKIKFKDLAVLGDMRIILDSTKRTYQQHMEIAQQAKDTEKASNYKKILDELKSFISALDTSEQDESKFEEQFDKVKTRTNEKSKILNKMLDLGKGAIDAVVSTFN